MTEDSDLLVFGNQEYTKVLYKLDFERNTGQVLSLSNVLRQGAFNNKFLGLDNRMFKTMAVFVIIYHR